MTLYLFIPCYIQNLAPQVAEALIRLLDFWGVPWHYPPEQTCCGQFAFNEGDWRGARRLMRHFLAVFAPAGRIICPGASCVFMVRHCYPQLAATPQETGLVARVRERLVDFSEWLVQHRPLLPWEKFTGRLLFHQSCAARRLGLQPRLREILGWLSGVAWQQVPDTYRCCGFGGLFALKQPRLSQAIGLSYLEAAAATGATGIVSTDSGCLLHLQGLLAGQGRSWPTWQLVEFLASFLTAAG